MAQSEKSSDHVVRYRASNGAEGHMWDKLAAPGSYPCLLLTTIGRKSQILRTTPLVYGRDGDNYTVIASQGGKPTHPAWYLNLVETPRVELQVGPEVYLATARSATGNERHRLWQLMKGVYPLVDEYKAKVGNARIIPLVIFAPD